jgi:hypothetical protein
LNRRLDQFVLPVLNVAVSQSDEESGSASGDLFHRGVTTKLFPSNNLGLIRIQSGREIPFSFDLVILLGDVKKPNELKEGQEVGYDVGWTSNGLRVTKIKTYSQSTPSRGRPE